MNHKRDPLFADAVLVTPDDPSQRPDPLYVPEPEDETVEVIAVDLQRTFGMGGAAWVDYRDEAYRLVDRVRELDGQASARSGIVFVIIAAALAGALAALVIGGIVQASAAPRSVATAIPTAGIERNGLPDRPSSGNPSLPTEAPAAASTPSLTGELDEGGAFGGSATWYCSSTSPCTAGYRPTDLVAAIDPTLGIPKGARVRVDYRGLTLVVTIVDVCACGGERLIDLTSGAFVHLAPLSLGRIPVSIVELRAQVTPPATGTEP